MYLYFRSVRLPTNVYYGPNPSLALIYTKHIYTIPAAWFQQSPAAKSENIYLLIEEVLLSLQGKLSKIPRLIFCLFQEIETSMKEGQGSRLWFSKVLADTVHVVALKFFPMPKPTQILLHGIHHVGESTRLQE